MVDRPDCPCAAGHGRNRPQTLKRPQMLSDERVGQSSAGRGSRSLLVRSRRASPYIVNRTLSWAVRTRRTPTDRMGTAAWLEHHVRRLGQHLWKRHGVHLCCTAAYAEVLSIGRASWRERVCQDV